MTAVIIILLSAVAAFIGYKYFKSKSEKKVATTKSTIRQNGGGSVNPISTQSGYASDGSPVKLPNESNEDFAKREAQWYYTNVRG
tara:strand:+ start:3127 stop:3381 length:255 start_codon:yes stop_codon:yes gene_type:complete